MIIVFLLPLAVSAQVHDLQGGPIGVERVATLRFENLSYRSPLVDSANAVAWLQIDLGKTLPVEEVKLLPLIQILGFNSLTNARVEFPLRFKIETAKEGDPDFANPALIHDQTYADCDGTWAHKVEAFKTLYPVDARYVRLTVTKMPRVFSVGDAVNNRINYNSKFVYRLWRFEVISGGEDVSHTGKLSDSYNTPADKLSRFLRPRRPDGEFAYYDHPENVTSAASWKPVALPLQTPCGGVTVGGFFGKILERNEHYLLNGFTVSDMARDFRQRAGKPVPEKRDYRPEDNSPWLNALGGSNAGRFLMGAGNSLRWHENAELRRWVDELVKEIEDCIEPSGFGYGFPERNMFEGGEEGAYARSWLTMGLIDAGKAGNTKAFEVARRATDWFNHCPYLPEMLLHASFGIQGLIPNTRLYVETDYGKPDDIQAVQRYMQLNHWLEQLAQADPKAINEFPYDRPHSYMVNPLNALMDMYFATGDEKYLNAAAGGWKIFHDYFEHVGGSIAICEGGYYAPHSQHLRQCTGEFCGTTFWVFLNQQFRRLYPEDEKYAAEIEKSIYNPAASNQCDNGDILYHAKIVAPKHSHEENDRNTCCEGQGTRLFGALPEFIYKTDTEGVWVDLFNESSITWEQPDGAKWTLTQTTDFPAKPDVALKIKNRKTATAKIRVRIPSWAAKDVLVAVNGKTAATGKPGSYVTLERRWKSGDEIRFTLPMEFRLTRYSGITGGFANAYALEYGPVLMACIGDS
ncbi:MAG: glycoside hydrolase family 127 protein, partial [Tannerella sp.]|nr:glycoside hydrolase family 127 protein [Tannerella sp.]